MIERWNEGSLLVMQGFSAVFKLDPPLSSSECFMSHTQPTLYQVFHIGSKNQLV